MSPANTTIPNATDGCMCAISRSFAPHASHGASEVRKRFELHSRPLETVVALWSKHGAIADWYS